jgi:carboxypeptidase family protein
MFRRSPKISGLVALVALALVLAPASYGQAIDGNLAGAVLDATGATIPNATVELENTETGIKYTTTTGTDGLYRFNNVPVGPYALNVQAPGFANAGMKTIVELNKTATANVSLQVQGVTAEVIVVDAPSSIDTTTAQLQSTFKTEQIVNTPMVEAAGNFYGAMNLAMLSAGVASNGGVGMGLGPSVGGQRPTNNNFMVEGVDNNNKVITGPLVYVPAEATKEFSLLQNQFNSEFGHSTGGQFNTIVNSGTNKVSGTLYEYFQNRNLNATGQEFKRQGISKPRFDQNRFGAGIGGPIIPNKWFYFGNFEYAPLGQAFTPSAPVRVPTAAGYGLLEAMPGLSKTNLGILKQYGGVAPQQDSSVGVDGTTIPVGLLPVVGKNYINQYAAVGSTDYNFSDRNQLRGRYIFNRVDQIDTTANLPAFWASAPQRYHLVTAALYHTFSSDLLNETRIGYNRFAQTYPDPGITFPGLDRFANITPEDLGINIGPNQGAPQFTFQNTYQLVDNLSWFTGPHNFKFGFEGRRVILPQHVIQRERGDYGYSKLEKFLHDDVPDNLAQRNLGTTQYYGNNWSTNFYGQDDFHLRRNLTINFGLRWERTTVPQTMKLGVLNAISSVPGLLEFREPNASNKAFAPRIGFAYSPGTSGNTSIRAGFGMAYDVVYDNVGTSSYPPQLSATINANSFPGIFAAPFLANGGIKPGSVPTGSNLTQTQARAATSTYVPDQILPYSIQWNLGVQHQFAQDYTFEMRYLGNRGVHLLVQNQMFRFPLVTSTRNLPTYMQAPTQAQLDALAMTLPQFGTSAQQALARNPVLGPLGFSSNITWFPPTGNSEYHGLATQLTRRFSRGMSMMVAHTWSHNIDDSTATHNSTALTPRRAQDFMNMSAEKSDSALDRRHRLTFNWTYEPQWMKDSSNWAARNLLGNWRWIGTYTYESPEFVTVQSGVDSNLNGDSATDRAIINVNGDPTRGSNVRALCNSSLAAGATCGATGTPVVAYLATDPTAMYIKAAAGTYANGGRNTLATRPIDNFDMSFAKTFTMKEEQRLEFRGDFTNIFNHAQYTPGYVNSVRKNDSYNLVRTYLIPGQQDFAKWDQVFSSHSRGIQLVLRYHF